MRNAVIFLAVAILLIVSGIMQLNYLEDSSNYLIGDVNYIKNLVYNNDFSGAKDHMNEFEDTWNNMSNIWCIFIHHNETEELKRSMTNLKTSLELENNESAYMSIDEIIDKLKQITRKQEVRAENVF